MVDWAQDIGAYLEGNTRSYTPLFTIFPDWTRQDYDDVCSRIEKVLTEVGIPLISRFPRITTKHGRVSLNAAYRQRIAAETLLFGRYNQDGLLLLPHQKDPYKPRPSWFRDDMLVPGPRSLGQKLLVVSYRKIQDEAAGRRVPMEEMVAPSEQQAHQTDDAQPPMSPTESENTVTTQAATITPSASAKAGKAAAKQPSRSSAVAIKSRPTKNKRKNERFGDLTIYIGTIIELDDGQLVMRKSLRDAQSWLDNSAPKIFDFETVRRSVGLPAGCGKELFFFPDMNKDPHTMLNEEELLGGLGHLMRKSTKEHPIGSMSLFVAADIDHVRSISLDQRGKFDVSTIYRSRLADSYPRSLKPGHPKCHCAPGQPVTVNPSRVTTGMSPRQRNDERRTSMVARRSAFREVPVSLSFQWSGVGEVRMSCCRQHASHRGRSWLMPFLRVSKTRRIFCLKAEFMKSI